MPWGKTVSLLHQFWLFGENTATVLSVCMCLCVYEVAHVHVCMCVRAFVYSPLLLSFVTVCASHPFRVERTHVISVKLLCDRLV